MYIFYRYPIILVYVPSPLPSANILSNKILKIGKHKTNIIALIIDIKITLFFNLFIVDNNYHQQFFLENYPKLVLRYI